MNNLQVGDRVVLISGPLKGSLWHYKGVDKDGLLKLWHPLGKQTTSVHPSIVQPVDEQQQSQQQQLNFWDREVE